MIPMTKPFEFDYFGSMIIYGRGQIERLRQYLSKAGLTDALLVCGPNVASNEELMKLVREGFGDRLAGVFDGTTTEKTLNSVYQGIEMMLEVDADVLVGLGGGSSLDTARQMGVIAADGRDQSSFYMAAHSGEIDLLDPQRNPTPVIVVPTTLAGADISNSGSIQVLSADASPTDQPVRVSSSNMPIAMVYDPELFSTTPQETFAASAMNGFDKPLETLYANSATPITDATAVHSLRLFRKSFPNLFENPEYLDSVVVSIILGQFRRRLSVIHAVGHGFSRRYSIHQGNIHAVAAPHVLNYLFKKIDARRRLLASGLGVDASLNSDTKVADDVVESVIMTRDMLGLPSRFRDLDPVEREDFPKIAQFIVDDYLMANAPTGLNPSPDELEEVLHCAW